MAYKSTVALTPNPIPTALSNDLLKTKDEKIDTKGYLSKRPGEPDFKMNLSLNQVVFICTSDRMPVYRDIKIYNPTKDKQAFKVEVELLFYYDN
uniref:MSP domain-containing protein n=1 Tax=Heterorhabditis bacteriophora TaxID=37862 RepID=A0A1I7W9N4_HETBA